MERLTTKVLDQILTVEQKEEFFAKYLKDYHHLITFYCYKFKSNIDHKVHYNYCWSPSIVYQQGGRNAFQSVHAGKPALLYVDDELITKVVPEIRRYLFKMAEHPNDYTNIKVKVITHIGDFTMKKVSLNDVVK